MKMKWYHWTILSGLVLFLPIAIVAAINPPNEYLPQGLNAIDCEGPLGVMLVAIPGYFLYGTGAFVFIRNYMKIKSSAYLVIGLICCAIIAAITPNVLAAVKQHDFNSTVLLEYCGEGW